MSDVAVGEWALRAKARGVPPPGRAGSADYGVQLDNVRLVDVGLDAMKLWQCAWRSTDTSGTLFVNTLHVQVFEDPDDNFNASADGVADGVDAAFTTLYRAMLNTAYTVNELAVRELRTATPEAAAKSLAVAGTLANATSLLPIEVCGIITWKSNVATRSGRGRMFVPSPRYSSYLTTNDAWNTGAAYWTAMGAFAAEVLTTNTFVEGGVTYTIQPVVYSRAHDQANEITSYVRRQRPHWLRSRSTSP